MPPQKSVGIWLRVSTEDQARGESPQTHEKRARMYAEAREWNVREVYHLEAVSGKARRVGRDRTRPDRKGGRAPLSALPRRRPVQGRLWAPPQAPDRAPHPAGG